MSIFDIPLEFISEYLTGWTLIIFICIIIYFAALRKYYIKREEFYTNATTELFNNKRKKKKREGFTSDMTNSTKPNSTKPNSTTPTSSTQPSRILDSFVSTTLFDNLKLNTVDVQKCITYYNTVIIYCITEFTKLIKLINNNKYLNVEKQFNTIIAKAVDNIINFLNTTIKSMNILTRNSIKVDLLNTIDNTIDNLISKENKNLTNEINELAKLNSTTIDYTTMVKTIDASRNKIEEYIEIDKLISKFGMKNTISENKVNKVLDKSFILPIYEKNFDRINQLVNSDFNNNYTQLAEKYGKSYTDHLNQKKKEELNINPLEMLSNIESGVVSFLTNLTGGNGGSGGNNGSNSTNGTNGTNDTKLIEQYNAQYGHFDKEINTVQSNPIPEQNKNTVKNNSLNKNNIYQDSCNLGSYLINKDTQKQMIEGFETSSTKPNTPNELQKDGSTSTTTNTTTTNPTVPVILTTKPNITNKKKKTENDENIVSKLLSGEFLEYIMEVVNSKINSFYNLYSNSNVGGYDTDTSSFNLEKNLIPAGFLLFILSMLIYFIDLTS
jgi:hypothetical protein